MTDLSLSRHLQLQKAPLQVSSYFDPATYQAEQQRIFSNAPKYVGHSLAVPNVGDYYALPQEGEGRVLMHTPDGRGGSRLELISNICRHRQAVMLHGRGHQEQSNYALQSWNGLQFDAASTQRTDLNKLFKGMKAAKDLDFSGYVFHRAIQHECAYNWKTFIEVYLEDYHVGPFHPGLGQFVACDELQWEYGANWSVQTVGVADKLGKPGSDVYQKWHDAVLNYRGGQPPAHGAIWLTLYPTVMVEWYPHVLTVSTLYPQGPQKTLNLVEFFYPEEIAAFEPDFIEAQQAAYMETCEEDDEIALRMDAGRKALMARGDNESGPYQSPMEDGMRHFHQWYVKVMGES
jgi:choline monooxygenase